MEVNGIEIQPIEIDGVQWVSAQDAAAILSANSGHTISVDYPRRLASPAYGSLEARKITARAMVYRLDQLRDRVIRKGPGRHPKSRDRKPRRRRPS